MATWTAWYAAEPAKHAPAAINPASGGTGKGSLKIENMKPTRNPPMSVVASAEGDIYSKCLDLLLVKTVMGFFKFSVS